MELISNNGLILLATPLSTENTSQPTQPLFLVAQSRRCLLRLNPRCVCPLRLPAV